MTKNKRWLAIAVSFLMVMSCFAAAAAVPASAAVKAPKKIYVKTNASIVEPIRTVDIGGTLQAKVYKTVPSSASKAVTWKSSKTSVAAVSSKGVITGKKKGTAYITAKSTKNSKVTAKIKVYVRDVNPSSVSLNWKSKTLTAGDTLALKATVKHIKNGLNPKDKVASWSTSDKNVATVSKGKVTAVAAGTATITAKAGIKKASCKITVKAAPVTVTGIAFEKETLDLVEKESGINKLIFTPENASAPVEYTSDNEKAATVDADGKVTGVAPGTAVITAKVQGTDGKEALTASFTANILKDESIRPSADNANQYRIKPALLNYDAKDGPYIATVGKWRADNSKSAKDTYFVNGEALSDHDIIISNSKMGMVLAVGTRNPWGYPAGSVMDAGYIKNGAPARDTIWSLEFLVNGWDSWAPENCGTVEFDLTNYDFDACKEAADGLAAVKVTRNYTQITAGGENCDMTVNTYYSIAKDSEYAYMYDEVINNGKADVAGKTTRFALTNKGDDGGSLKYLKENRAVVSYGNKTGQEYAICHTVPKKQTDSKVNVNANGGSLGYKELRTPCSYPAGSTTTYQEYFMVSDRADTAQLTNFSNKINGTETMTVSGTVTDDSNQPVADAAVVVKDGDNNLFGFYRADKDGKFSIELPKGGYDLYTEKAGYGKGAVKSVIRASADLNLKAGAQKTALRINLKDRDGNALWGKVDIEGEYPEVRYTGNSVFQAREKGVIQAEVANPENFKAKVYGEGYFFYSEPVEITEKDVKDGAVDVTIEQKIARPEGWLSGDLHHHANKNDGFADPEDAIPSQLASALDVSYITDHDFTVNNKKSYDLINGAYKGQIKGFIPSEEISCSWAHFNVLPQGQSSYDFFLDADRENHVVNQFGKFPEFTKETHDRGANITANHPWYSYGLFSTAANNAVPGGYTDDYDTIEINACSADSENADTLISAAKLWTAYLDGGSYFGAKVEKPHYLVAGSDTHDVLVPGVTNKGSFARGESEHYNTGKARTFASAAAGSNITDTGLAFDKAVADGNSYISFGPVLTMDKVPGGARHETAESFEFNVTVKSLAKVTDVLLLTKDAVTPYKTSGLVGAMQDQNYLNYEADQSVIGTEANSKVQDGIYKFNIPVKAGEKTWAAVLVMDENGNYAVTNPYWITGGAQ